LNVIDQIVTDRYAVYNGDCVEVARGIPENSIHYTIFSPPFEGLYTYSDSLRDFGNSKNSKEFQDHFQYLVKEIFRITMPGRLVSFHCMDIPAMKSRDGYIGLKDFPGQLIQMFQEEGFIYHSKVTIFKDPLIEAVRTKAIGLMHKQLVKDSAMCRQGLPDYLVTMRKPGENPEPITHPEGFTKFIGEDEPDAPKKEPTLKDSREHRFVSMASTDPVYSHHVWRRYASPVWMDINQSRTLQKTSAREEKDEKHICPLQLDVIDRAIELWSNPGDTVFSPFGGIGSEGYVALEKDRKSVSIELKGSYYEQNVKNHAAAASNEFTQPNLF
jgi:DNA modification methylase